MRPFLLICLSVGLAGCGLIVQLTADARDEDVALWIHDADIAPGDTVEATVRVDRGARVRIDRIVIEGAGPRQIFDGAGDTWGDKIVTKTLAIQSASASVDFTIQVPTDAEPGSHLALVITVSIVEADAYGTQFENRESVRTFHRDVTIQTVSASTWGRVVHAGFAAGACLVVIGLVVLIRRWHARRNITPSLAWGMLLLPYVVPGYVVFVGSLGRALRMHGVVFTIICLVVWYAVLVIPTRLVLRAGMHRYLVAPIRIETSANDAYRASTVTNPETSVIEFEGAWMAVGLKVERRGDQLFVAWPGLPAAIVKVPPSDMLGGTAFEILSRDRQTVIKMLDAVAPLLGELRCTSSHEAGELRFK